jgi:hypothetical protein
MGIHEKICRSSLLLPRQKAVKTKIDRCVAPVQRQAKHITLVESGSIICLIAALYASSPLLGKMVLVGD